MVDVLTQPTARTFRLEELIGLVRGGEVRVPHFQRDFRWDVRDVVKLFDSIMRGYPVGSVLLWRRPSPAGKVRIGVLEIEALESAQALWVVDGQQRITSLVNALSDEAYGHDEKFKLDYDLKTHKIVRHADADKHMSIPLPTIFDLRRLLAWVQSRPDLNESITEINDVAARLRDFALPASIVEHADQATLQEIFNRMNNSGKRLRRAEVFSAIFAPAENVADHRLTFAKISDNVDLATSFGRIDEDTVLKVVLARRNPDVARDFHNEFEKEKRVSSEFPNESLEQAYALGEAALKRSIVFLREAGIPHFSFLPYRYLLIVLTRFFAHFPDPHPRNVVLLKRWFWQSVIKGPGLFRGGTPAATRVLASAISPDDENGSVRALLASIQTEGPLRLPGIERFRTNASATRILMCALWAEGPRDFITGEVVTRAELAASLEDSTSAVELVLDIIPRLQVPQKWKDNSANRALIFQGSDIESARSILAGNPRQVEQNSDASAILGSHLVDAEASLMLQTGDFVDFLERREAAMRNVLEQFLTVQTGLGFAPTPPLSSMDLDHDSDGDEVWA